MSCAPWCASSPTSASRRAPRRSTQRREFPWDLKELLAQQDLLGTCFEERHGGTALDGVAQSILVEEIARADATTSLIPIVQKLGALPIMLAGSDEQKDRYLPAPRLRRVARRLRPDRGGRRQRRRRQPHARHSRRRRLRPQRQQALHHPRLGRQPRHHLRADRSGGRRPQGDERVHRRDRHARLRRAARGAQDGHPRLADRRAHLRRRPRARSRTASAPRGRASGSRWRPSTGPGWGSRRRRWGSRRARSTQRSPTRRTARQFGQRVADFQGIQWMLADMASQTEAARQLTYAAAARVDANALRPAVLDQQRQARRWRHRHARHHRCRPGPGRIRLYHRVPRRAHDARRQDHPALRGNPADPAPHHRPPGPRQGRRGQARLAIAEGVRPNP